MLRKIEAGKLLKMPQGRGIFKSFQRLRLSIESTTWLMKKNKIQISYLLRPHWKTLAVAFAAVVGESAADLLEPWPLKAVFDYVLGSKKMLGWLAPALFIPLRDTTSYPRSISRLSQ